MSTAERTPRAQSSPATLRVFLRGRLSELEAADRAALLDRRSAEDEGVSASVRETIADVRRRGDAALVELAALHDGATLRALEVPRALWKRAWEGLESSLQEAISEAAANVRAFHEAQRPAALVFELRPGVTLGRRADPLARVAVYAPGGRAAYPSSVLMGVVPARVAGVGEVFVASPPGPDGLPPAVTLAAAHHAGADRLFALGGAGAVAAFAYGTGSVPRADKIVGPGNAWVTEAKRQLAHLLASDNPAGPSEVLVIADETADAEQAAAELLAQAEHDPRAACVLAAIGEGALARFEDALRRALPERSRRTVIEEALANRGALLEAADLDEALGFCADFAPEHLILLVREPRAALDRVRNAGTVLLGESATVAFGDYASGANHVLPTGGAARAHSGLSLLDFVRWTTWQEVDAEGAPSLAPATVRLAESEGLEAHAHAARLRAAKGVPSPAPSPRGRRRSEYRDLHVYRESGGGAEVDLSDNTNLFGTAPAAVRALSELGEDAARYPTLMGEPLKDALADRFGLEPERLITGCGSDDLIDCAMRAFGGPGARVVFPVPTFVMIDHYARANGVEPVPVPLTGDLTLDEEALLASGAGVLYLARPNNPTGTLFERDAVLRLVDRAPGVAIVDEAYAEIAGESLLDELRARENALVFRTFSKAYGLAGLRAGWGTGSPALVAELEKARGPFKLSIAAERAATAAVREDAGWIEETARRTAESRERLAAELTTLGLHAYPSAANFVFVPVIDAGAPGGEETPSPARRLDRALRARGVAVRAFPGSPVTGDAVRITVAPVETLARFLEALPEALLEAKTKGRTP